MKYDRNSSLRQWRGRSGGLYVLLTCVGILLQSLPSLAREGAGRKTLHRVSTTVVPDTPKREYFCADAEGSSRLSGRGRVTAPAGLNSVPFTRASVLRVHIVGKGTAELTSAQRGEILDALVLSLAAWRYGCAQCSRANALALYDENSSEVLMLSALADYISERPANGLLDLGALRGPGITKLPEYGSPVSPIDFEGSAIFSRIPGASRQSRSGFEARGVSLYSRPSDAVRARICASGETDDVINELKDVLACVAETGRASGSESGITVAVTNALTQCGYVEDLVACEKKGLIELSLIGNRFFNGANVGLVKNPLGSEDSSAWPVDLVIVLMHEIGHWLGVPHAPNSNQQSVMQTSIGEGMCLDKYAIGSIGMNGGMDNAIALIARRGPGKPKK